MNTSDPKKHKLLLDLLNRMLKWDAEERIEPLEVINHPFFLSKPRILTKKTAPDQQTVGSRAAELGNGANVQRQTIDERRSIFSRTVRWFSKIHHYLCTCGQSGSAQDQDSVKEST